MEAQQPEALRLAGHLEFPDGCPNEYVMRIQAAAELRRLHAENQALRQALADAALDKMAENARELGLSYEQPSPAQLQDIEQYRLQMAAISTAALGYWKKGDGIHPDYVTPALHDVADLYAKYNELFKQKAEQPAPAQACDHGWKYIGSKRQAMWECTKCGMYKVPDEQPAPAEPDADELTIAYMSGLHEGKKRKPLTDEQIVQVLGDVREAVSGNVFLTFARAIEAAHGITKEN